MADQILLCQNCGNQFVYSEFEQRRNEMNNLPAPSLCPICTSIKQQENLRPKKPETKTTEA